MTDPILTLPESLRDAFAEPLGPVTTDVDALLAAAEKTCTQHGQAGGRPRIVAVGDVVTYHLREAGQIPDVAVIDGKTEREAVREEIEAALAAADGRRIAVENPAAGLSGDLLAGLTAAIADDGPVTVNVTGEEDLATLPAVLAAPLGSTVVYGQPGDGMVRVAVTAETRAEARDLFNALNGDTEAAAELLGVAPDSEGLGADDRS